MRRVFVLGCALVLVAAGCGWARPRYDAGNSGNNPFEQKISAANVGTLQHEFTVQSSRFSSIPAFVVARQHIYVDGQSLAVYSSDGLDGCVNVSRTCFPQWTLTAESGAPEVLGSTLYLGGAAFDADGTQACSGTPKRCGRVWSEAVGSAPFGVTDPNGLHFNGFRHSVGRASEMVGVSAYSVPCAPAPADCPLRWSADMGGGSSGGIIGGPSVGWGRVYGSYSRVGANGTLSAFDGTNGNATQLWSAPLDGVGGTSVVLENGIVVTTVNTTAGTRLEAFDSAGVNGCSGAPKVCTALWSTDAVSAGIDAAPAIAHGVVYRAVGSQLRAYDAAGTSHCSGAPKVCTPMWVAPVGPNVTAPAVANGLVYASSSDGTVAAFDAAGTNQCSATTRVCSALWNTNVSAAAGPVEIADGRVYVGNATGFVWVFKPQ